MVYYELYCYSDVNHKAQRRLMHIISLGLNHLTAPVHLREKLAFNEEQVRAALSRVACGHMAPSFTELVVVSTCNRIEIYAASSQLAFAELEAFLSDAHGVPVHEFHSYLYRFEDLEAARHLFDVAAGLDSLVIGEPQILGQITRALELARGQNVVGPTLNRLFQAAIHAGKRARTETAISRNPASVSSLAASVAEKTLGHIKTASVVVLGAGEMAELTVEALRKRGVEKIRVINRTLERAQELAKRWGAESATFESLQQSLCEADILISSTGAPHLVVDAKMVTEVMRSRAGRTLVLIDIAVPRDIDPDCMNIPHVKLFDIDGLNSQLEDSLTRRMDEVPHVRQILEEELSEFEKYLESLEMLPIIADIHQRAEAIRAAELKKTLRRMPDLTDVERERIEALTQALVQKLLDHPTRHLRAEAASQHAPEYAALARKLFNLSEEQQHPASTAAD
ncbi:MAG: glutamyl-tRNA reductase [Chloroflexi bacterium]|nr:MAG: glutamyl-tRNA reductase [Chloroflexota bacterium]